MTESFVHNRFTVTLSTEALEKASADGTNLPQVIASSLAGPGLGVTLLEDIISEGISSAFDTAAFPGPPDPWDRAISRTQECASWKKAQPLLQHTKLYDEWMFGGPGIPHWTAFTIGYDIVTDYHQHHPDTSWPTITSTSAYAILAGSRYQPCSS